MARPRATPEIERLLQRQRHAVQAAARLRQSLGRGRRLTAEECRAARGLICDLGFSLDALERCRETTGRAIGSAVRSLNVSLAYLTVGRVVTPPRGRGDATDPRRSQ